LTFFIIILIACIGETSHLGQLKQQTHTACQMEVAVIDMRAHKCWHLDPFCFHNKILSTSSSTNGAEDGDSWPNSTTLLNISGRTNIKIIQDVPKI